MPANHMPAPWSLANVSAAERGPVQIKSRHGLTVGTAYTVDDARVMAVAPELLAALEAVTERVGSRQPCCPEARYSVAVHHADCPYLAATKLIARARGEGQRRTDAEGARAVAGGLRLLGCPHPTSCTSISECGERPRP